jgi:hypothetical protein
MARPKADVGKKSYRNSILRLLRQMEITPKGFYDYDDFSNLVGYVKPSWPFTVPSKVSIEISNVNLTHDQILAFITLAKDSQATKLIIFGIEDKSKLDESVKEVLKITGIEYFGPNDIKELLKGVSITDNELDKFKQASEVVAAPRLVESLPELALQKIPAFISTTMNSSKVKIRAWEIFEEAVYASFHFCLGYNTEKLGKEARFENEPEAIVVVEGTDRFGFLYDCKSAKSEYSMSMDDQRAYIDYINAKKPELKAIYGVELRYFVIVAPAFAGDKKIRRTEILRKTGVTLVYITASQLKTLAEWAYRIKKVEIKQLIDLGQILSKADEVEVKDDLIQKFTREFDRKFQLRY